MVRKTNTLAAASVALLAPTTHAAGFVQWDISKRHHLNSKVERRAGTQQEIVVNSLVKGGYFATCTVGSPGQDVTLQLDTGSSDIWVPANNASICNENACTLGSFDSANSSTFDNFGPDDFAITYVDGSYSNGDYFRDAFSVANATIQNMTMGLGRNTTISYGLLGLGYTLNEAIVAKEGGLSAEYPNLPVMMVNEGLIATNAYSLWLNDLDASTGSLLFGGIDTQKYVGNMTRISIQQNRVTNQYDSFIVELTSIFASSSSGVDELLLERAPLRVVLDSGTTLSYLPTNMAQQFWDETGAVYVASVGTALIPCSMRRSTGYFTFNFAGQGGPSIQVEMNELVLGLVAAGPAPLFTSGKYSGQDACEFGIQNTTGMSLLGDTFLRSAYVVYDLVNHEIGLAQTDFNETESNIVAFPSKGAVIPSAVLASNSSPTAATPASTQNGYQAGPGFANGTQSGAATTASRSVIVISTFVVATVIIGGVSFI